MDNNDEDEVKSQPLEVKVINQEKPTSIYDTIDDINYIDEELIATDETIKQHENDSTPNK